MVLLVGVVHNIIELCIIVHFVREISNRTLSVVKEEAVHYMQLPREVIVGKDVVDQTGDICTRLGFRGTALIVSGPVTYPLAGERVAKSVTRSGFKVEHLIVEESTEPVLGEVVESVRKTGANVVLGVGGGK